MSAELVVVAFKGIDKAAEVLAELEAMEEPYYSTMQVEDAVAVYRDLGGVLRLARSIKPTTDEAAKIGAVLGALLGALTAIPFTGGASLTAAVTVATTALGGGVMGGASAGLTVEEIRAKSGLSEEFVRTVAASIQPGDSVLLALIRAGYPEQVAERFRGSGGKILQSTLTPEQRERLQRILESHQRGGRRRTAGGFSHGFIG